MTPADVGYDDFIRSGWVGSDGVFHGVNRLGERVHVRVDGRMPPSASPRFRGSAIEPVPVSALWASIDFRGEQQ